MKVILGIDPGSQYLQTLRLLARMQFAAVALHMIHVRSKIEEPDENLIARAAHAADELGLSCHVHSEQGDPAEVLAHLAGMESADLIAIGSGEKGPMNALLRGSVGKSLMKSWSGSLLISKGHVDPQGRLDAVMGFDGSQHSCESIKRLAAWKPGGIRQVEVVSVETPLTADFELLRVQQSRDLGATAVCDIETIDEVARRGASLLKVAGFPSSSIGVVGDVVEELRRAMNSSKSDLLVLPAERRGILDRALFGSTSMAEAVGGHHSMLVIR